VREKTYAVFDGTSLELKSWAEDREASII